MNFKLLPYAVIVGLLAIIFLQRECTPKQKPCETNTDTITVPHYIQVPYKGDIKAYTLKPSKIIPTKSVPKALVPDSSYNVLYKQYVDLLKEHTYTKLYIDSLKIDTLGYVLVTDSVKNNNLFSRKFHYDLKFTQKNVDHYIPVQSPVKNQVYIGGGLSSTKTFNVIGAEAGMLFKTKKDNIYGITAGITTSGNIMFGVHSYWKIHVK